MTYYEIDYSTNLQIVGSQYPQVYDFIKGYSPEVIDNGLYTLYNSNLDGFPDKKPNLSGLKLANGAKFTDFVSGGFGDYLFILSPEAKSLLDKIIIEEHCFYPATIVSTRKKEVKDYYVMKIKSNNFDYIDFKQSNFVLQDRYLGNIKSKISIESAADFLLKEKKIAKESNWEDCIRCSTIKMQSRFFDLGLDLFKISKADNHWYISQKLFNSINQFKLSGLEFIKVDL